MGNWAEKTLLIEAIAPLLTLLAVKGEFFHQNVGWVEWSDFLFHDDFPMSDGVPMFQS